MSKIILNFFGEKISIDKPKSLSSLRSDISRVFFFTNQDAKEILLTYKEKGKTIIILNDKDLQNFLKSKYNIIDLDINQNSKIYQDNFNKIKEEKIKEKTILDELLKKKEELNKLKETKFSSEKKELQEIEDKIKELTQRKNKIKKIISIGMKQIEKVIKENNKKIENLQKKFTQEKNSPNNKLKSIHYKVKADIKQNFSNNKIISQKNFKLNLLDASNSWQISDETEAISKYADWRNKAITNPTKGQLLPAGFVSIKFNSLSDAEVQKYDAYVDFKLIKTYEGNAAKADNFEFEIRNNEVKKHTICIIATLSNGDEVISNIRNFFISKKGIGIWQSQVDQIKEMHNTWYYNWSVNPLSDATDKAEYVPMIWGNASENSSGDRKKEWNWIQNKEWKNYRYLLMFNEPDFKDQANMSPEQAVERWKYIQPIVDDEKTDVSSPVVAIPTVFYEDDNNDYNIKGGWFGKYNQLMAQEKYNDEFTAVHFYFDYPGDWVLDIFKRIHEATGKKLWITEWGVAQWSQVQDFDWVGGPDEGNWQRELITKFVKEILPILDETDYIERYAWFPFDGSNTDKFGNGAGGLFFNTESDSLYKQLTSVGKAYKEYGNPSGWDPNKITEDQVVKKKGESSDGGDDDTKKKNVLSGKKATASSESGSNKASNAIDSDLKTRWESQHGKDEEEWIMIELGDTYQVDGFKVVWENAAAKVYKIQISMEGNYWIDVYKVTDGKSGETKEGNFDLVSAKYIRLMGITKTMELYGFSIYDFQVFGVKEGSKLKNTKKDGIKMKIENSVHFGVKCFGCQQSPIKGKRYKCAICNNFNYCEKCEEKFSKKHNHPYLLFCDSKSRPVFFGKK